MEYRVHPVLFDYLFFPLLKLEDPSSSLNTLTKYLILGLKYFKECGYEFLRGVLTLWNRSARLTLSMMVNVQIFCSSLAYHDLRVLVLQVIDCQ
ncbi:MAG: hypothetical protein WA220_06415 [Candidatus Nitrosopolaris sp.]